MDDCYKDIRKITVVGAGYVGLSLAVVLASGYDVTVVDVDAGKISRICKGESPIEDTLLSELLRDKTGGLQLTATTDVESAYYGSDLVCVAVPTDYDVEGKCLDTAILDAVLDDIRVCCSAAIVVIKSTAPIGYTRAMKEKTGLDLLFVPEFLREGTGVHDTLMPDRIVIGADMSDPVQAVSARSFGKVMLSVIKKQPEVLFMGHSEAESVKLFSNAYLALRVAYFNELDVYAEAIGLDTSQIIRGVCLDGRIGDKYNNPGFGFGGPCLPKDTKQLSGLLAESGICGGGFAGYSIRSNEWRLEHVVDNVIRKVYGKTLPIIGIFGMGMKGGHRDIRHSVMIDLVKLLRERGMMVVIYEPCLSGEENFMDCEVVENLEVFKRKSDVILANRYDFVLDDVVDKVYTRDLFGTG